LPPALALGVLAGASEFALLADDALFTHALSAMQATQHDPVNVLAMSRTTAPRVRSASEGDLIMLLIFTARSIGEQRGWINGDRFALARSRNQSAPPVLTRAEQE
jgi:hypothetical protein